jgi:hypothetical protein
MKKYRKKNKPACAVRASAADYRRQEGICNIPLRATAKVRKGQSSVSVSSSGTRGSFISTFRIRFWEMPLA